MKKRILIALAALTILLCVPLIANAASVDDLTFDKKTGMITDCNQEAEGELVIPEKIGRVKVTGIDKDAFMFCANLTSVNIPEGVTSIGDDAFYHCTSLTSIYIPDSVTSIGINSFNGCSSLENVDIPDSIVKIYDGTFSSCTDLKNVNIPNSVTSISCC